jgi:hypothetical protein
LVECGAGIVLSRSIAVNAWSAVIAFINNRVFGTDRFSPYQKQGWRAQRAIPPLGRDYRLSKVIVGPQSDRLKRQVAVESLLWDIAMQPVAVLSSLEGHGEHPTPQRQFVHSAE